MAQEEIHIKISGGKIEVEARGIKGKGCEKVNDEVLKALGTKPKERKKKPEYYAHETVKEKVHN
jgi:hypothetical protein